MAADLAYESKFQWLTRLGFAARGLLYILIGLLAFRTGRSEDLPGALEYVGHGSGKLLLIGIVAGLATYGLWRLSDAAFGTEHPGTDWKALGKRAAAAGIGIIYLYLALKGARVLLGGQAGGAGPQDGASAALHLPGGELVLLGVAAGLAVASIVQFRKAVLCGFMRRLREGASQQAWIKWMGRLGYAARGVIFLVLAELVYRAAADRSATEVGNLETALDVLGESYLTPIAAGLMLFGMFSLVEARFRAIHRPPVDGVAQRVKEKLAR